MGAVVMMRSGQRQGTGKGEGGRWTGTSRHASIPIGGKEIQIIQFRPTSNSLKLLHFVACL